VDGYVSDRFTFHDAECKPRSAALVRTDARDPGGSYGGFLRRYTCGSRTIDGTGANGWKGWGYVVMHYANTAATSRGTAGTYKTVLAGKHHAIHELKVRLRPGGNADVTMHWLLATGRSHPLLGITMDSSPAGADAFSADTRTPYGDMAWDVVHGDVEGIARGDKMKFTTTGAGALAMSTPWDYARANTIPFVQAWSGKNDAEMGAGRAVQAPAWGSSYGAVGQRQASAFGKTLSGYPFLVPPRPGPS
jgi:hypothetical protein